MDKWTIKLRDGLKDATGFQQSLDTLYEVVQDLGFTQVLYARQVVNPRLSEHEWVPLRLNTRNFPKGWEHTWRQFEAHDPYYHACFNGTLPFDWSDVQSNDKLRHKESEAWQYLADFGLDRGMTIPIHLPDGKFAVVSAILDRSNVDWDSLYENTYDTMFHLTHMFHKTISQRGFVDEVEVALPNILSPREGECLRWAALGKTSPEIAMILDRSVETVRLHIKNAMLKLDASTRTHAVAKAVQLGVLTAY
ncbi:LuxR family transcriptional regulator [Roseovarius sp.]|jgi:LuxR family transcriptional regulator|uniref:helix-turn-helix transcriptional regulator n=1 Tax=Roseovarius sp. TaxID=1486281 RepID=UPI00260CA66E|nr:LuxR family transcriptional regulator [Roseovarius sp.]MDM8167668.1 LuxR family transcriptional regulator [Roseovarius sp.]